MINDISGGDFDTAMLETAAGLNVPYVIPSIEPKGNQRVAGFWSTRFAKALEAGVRRWNIVLDPGLGFAKTAQHNLELLQQLPRLQRVPGTVGYLFAPAILIGASRKAFIR